MAGMECDVCGRPSIGVASSCLGAISFAFCQECCAKHAEPIFMFGYMFWDVGHEGEGLADWIKTLYTWENGQYISWEEFAAREKVEHRFGPTEYPEPEGFEGGEEDDFQIDDFIFDERDVDNAE